MVQFKKTTKRGGIIIFDTVRKGKIIDKKKIIVSPFDYSQKNKYQVHLFRKGRHPVSKFAKTRKGALRIANKFKRR